MFRHCCDSVPTLLRQCSDGVPIVFRLCSDCSDCVPTVFRLWSDNVPTVFRQCSNSQPWSRALADLTTPPRSRQVEIYHRRQRLSSLAKTATDLELHNEQEYIATLEQAIKLSPSEINTTPDKAYQEALTAVANCPHMPAQWPMELTSAMVRRACTQLHRDEAAFFQACWIVGWPDASSEEWDAQHARVCAIPGASWTSKVDTTIKLIVEDFLARRMMEQEGGTAGLSAMAKLLGEGVQHLPAALSEADTSRLEALANLAAAIAAVVQPGPVSQAQLSAFSNMEQERASLGTALTSLWNNSWWRRKREQAWTFVADEAMSAPQLESILRGLAGTPPEAHKAWVLAEAKLAQWRDRLREGATQELEEALARHACLAASQIAPGEATAEWLSQAEALRARIEWLQGYCSDKDFHGQLEQASATVRTAIFARASELELSAGVKMCTAACKSIQAGKAVSNAEITSMAQAFKDCTGLSPNQERQAGWQAWQVGWLVGRAAGQPASRGATSRTAATTNNHQPPPTTTSITHRRPPPRTTHHPPPTTTTHHPPSPSTTTSHHPPLTTTTTA